MQKIRAFAAMKAGAPLQPFEYTPKPLAEGEVEIQVESCGICHSDLSMIGNDWGNAVFPLVPGHEVVGKVVNVGPAAHRFKKGDRVGVGWFTKSCRFEVKRMNLKSIRKLTAITPDPFLSIPSFTH